MPIHLRSASFTSIWCGPGASPCPRKPTDTRATAGNACPSRATARSDGGSLSAFAVGTHVAPWAKVPSGAFIVLPGHLPLTHLWPIRRYGASSFLARESDSTHSSERCYARSAGLGERACLPEFSKIQGNLSRRSDDLCRNG